MTFSLDGEGIRGIILDIEGTTTPIRFVYDVLFPFVRANLSVFFQANTGTPKIQEIVRALKHEYDDDVRSTLAPPEWTAEPVAYVNWLMDQDRKSTALKALQGEIWSEGYGSGKLRGEVFPDVRPALERWKQHQLDVRIFSSGSVLAQRLLFGSTADGDLNSFLKGYFDTTLGPKAEPPSYVEIAKAFQLDPPHILFISDVTRELDAARKAGMMTLLCMRPGNPPQVVHGHTTIASFDAVVD